jgi:glycosyltransferase involved in cell wall biosynthesis
MAEIIFYSSIALMIYTFIGYPALLYFSSLFFKREVNRAKILPEVTIVIPVHNEDRLIGTKILNCLEIDYPKEKLSIIVASDGSTDQTEDIVNGFESEQIRFLQLPFRGGKVMAQNHAVQYCKSEIIIFTDVAILANPDCVKVIIQNFNDETIGAVSCRDMIVATDNKTDGERSYIQYDMFVRKYTSKLCSLIGVTGGFYAVRSEIAKGGWNPAFPPDFYVAIRCAKRGLRVIEDYRVIGEYKTAAKEWDEMNRKVRTINRGIHALLSAPNRSLLNPFKYGILSWQLISHKLLRWMIPFMIGSVFLSNMMILDQSFLLVVVFLMQLFMFIITGYAFLRRKNKNLNNVLKIALYFAIANIAIVKAIIEFAVGKKYVMWQPTKR